MGVIRLSIPPDYCIKVWRLLRDAYGPQVAEQWYYDIAVTLYNDSAIPSRDNVVAIYEGQCLGKLTGGQNLLRSKTEEEDWL